MAAEADALRRRYEGLPWLRVLDAFVLDVIGALDDASSARLVAMTPMLQRTFAMPDAGWRAIVRVQMDLDASDEQRMRDVWARQLVFDDERGQRHDPVAWAHAVSDAMVGPRDAPPSTGARTT